MGSEDRARLYDLAKAIECSVCGRQMTVAIRDGKPFLRCQADASHDGYQLIRTLTQRYDAGEPIDAYAAAAIEKRRRERLTEQGVDQETQALAIYGRDERHLVTAPIALRAIKALWPDVSREAVERAILICVQHNLNPLTKDLYIVHYGKKSDRDEVILGIDGNRKIAQRKTHYSFYEAPRPLQADEMVAMGEDPKVTLGVICVLKTPDGSLYYGYGFIQRNAAILGEEKGNTRFKMAKLRAERDALRQLVPDKDLPARVNLAVDGMFADISTVEMPAALLDFPEQPQGDDPVPGEWGDCPIHKKPFRAGQYGPHCTSKMPDGSYCKQKPKAKPAPKGVDQKTGEIIDGGITDLGPSIPEDLPSFDDSLPGGQTPASGTKVGNPGDATKGPEDVIARLKGTLKAHGFLNNADQLLTSHMDDYVNLLASFGVTKLGEIPEAQEEAFRSKAADFEAARAAKS